VKAVYLVIGNVNCVADCVMTCVLVGLGCYDRTPQTGLNHRYLVI
jgi:hypothetical protein